MEATLISNILEKLPVPLLTLDKKSQEVILVNERFISEFGYDIHEITHFDQWWTLMYPDSEYRKHVKSQWDTHIEALTKDQFNASVRAYIQGKKGPSKYVEINVTVSGRLYILTFTDLTRLLDLEQELERSNTMDLLTGLKNKRGYLDAFEMQVERARRYHEALSIMLVEVDQFRAVTEKYDKEVAENCIIHIANLLKNGIRSCDLLARFGEESFAMILPSTPVDGAAILAERLQHKIETIPYVYNGEVIYLTISTGLSGTSDGLDNSKEILRVAGQLLQKARKHDE